jgi:glutamine amidotransferase
LQPAHPEHVVATADYGGRVVAVVAAGNIYGTQFHPEKSQDNGEKILSAFAGL